MPLPGVAAAILLACLAASEEDVATNSISLWTEQEPIEQGSHGAAGGHEADHGFQKVISLPFINHKVIRSGEVLRLECYSKRSAYWKSPPTVESSRMARNYSREGQYYKAILEITPAVYSDTGYYECIHKRNYTDNFEISPVCIYVYVKDDHHLFVTESEDELLKVTEHNVLTIPCRITSPEVEVDWEWEGKDVESSRMARNYSREGQYYKAILEITPAVYSDTGYYECIHKRNYTDNFEISPVCIYVYVKDDHHLFVTESEDELLKVTEHNVLTIPCRITSPEVEVDWEWEGKDVFIRNSTDDGLQYYYNPTEGFTLHYLKTCSFGILHCIASLGDKKDESTYFVPTEEVCVANISDAEKMHIEVGRNVNLCCWVNEYKGKKFSWFWVYPNERNTTDHSIKINETNGNINGVQECMTCLTISNVTPADEGYYMCLFQDILYGEYASTYLTVYALPYKGNIWLSIGDKTYDSSKTTWEQDNVTLHCGVPVEEYKSQVLWFNGKDSKLIENTTEYKVLNTSTWYSYRSSINFPNISKNHSGLYYCNVTTYDGEEQQFNYSWTIEGLVAPEFVGANATLTDWNGNAGDSVKLDCNVTGRPTPTVKWYKDDKRFTIRANEKRIQLNNSDMTLEITYVRSIDDGTYKCEASNNGGTISKELVLKTSAAKTNTTGLIMGIVIMAIVFVVAVVIFIYKFREAQKYKRELISTGLNIFVDGAVDNLNPEMHIVQQADLLPYDKKWEFPRDKLKLGKLLGVGAFGVVRKAEAWGIVERGTVTTVAVKMARSADFAYIKALASEMKIMLHLGKHLNVVNLLGACTKDLNKNDFLVIVEFCRYGNLHNYIMRHRERFIDQIDVTNGKIDYTIGSELLERSTFPNSSKSKGKYAALSFSSHSGGSSSEEVVSSAAEPSSPVLRSTEVNSDMTACKTTNSDEESAKPSNNSVQPGCRSNYKDRNEGAILTRDLLCWSFQVSRGMEYLTGRKVLHGDLALRNILLADDNIVKICDFGLAKNMYKSYNYMKKGDSPLPVKWMAIEALRDRIFSTQSDVWSFGIVLWELFSLAQTPYPGMEADEKLYNSLLNGYRMERPQYATREIYQVMQNCWKPQPNQRPSFTELSEQLGALLEESVRAHYIKLNDPYVAMNSQMFDGRSDYLNMMSSPTYENMMSPSNIETERRHGNVPAAADQMAQEMTDSTGYLMMKGVSTHPHRAEKVDIFTSTTPPARNCTTTSEDLAREARPLIGDVSPASGQSTPANKVNKRSEHAGEQSKQGVRAAVSSSRR